MIEIRGNKGRKKGRVGLVISVVLPNKYQPEDRNKRIKSASCTIHTDKKPKQIIKMIKEIFKNAKRR